MGFTSGAASPCCFHHPEHNISGVVHGDDFTAMGLNADLDYYETELAENFELKIGRLGEGCKGDNQLRILNRIVTITATGLTYEADPRHVDLLVESLGLTQANSVANPGAKEPTADYDAQKHHEDDPLPERYSHKPVQSMTSEMQNHNSRLDVFGNPRCEVELGPDRASTGKGDANDARQPFP